MTGPSSISSAALANEAAKAEANEIAQQVASEDNFETDAQDNYNPMAAARAQARNDRFRSIDTRKETEKTAAVDEIAVVEGVDAKGEEDLAKTFQQRNSELPADQLLALKRGIREEQTEKEILDAVVSAFHDPTLTDEALDYLTQVTTGPLKEKISRVRQLLNEEKHREIIGGRNIDAVAKEYATAIGSSPTLLRDLYRDVTGTERDHNVLFAYLAAQYRFEQLKELVAFLLKGMAYDVKAKGPSIPPQELMLFMKEMKNLQSILWVYLFFKERIGMMKKLYGQYGSTYPEEMSFEKLALSFMKVVQDRYPSVIKVTKEVEQLGAKEDIEKVIVLSQYRDAIRSLSPRIYPTVQHKQNILIVLMEALEAIEIEKEEEKKA